MFEAIKATVSTSGSPFASVYIHIYVCVCLCECVCVSECVRECVSVCVCVSLDVYLYGLALASPYSVLVSFDRLGKTLNVFG